MPDLLQCVLLFMLIPAQVSRPTPNLLYLFCCIAAAVLLIPLRNGCCIRGGIEAHSVTQDINLWLGTHRYLALGWISDDVCELKVWLVKLDEATLQECIWMEIYAGTGSGCSLVSLPPSMQD